MRLRVVGLLASLGLIGCASYKPLPVSPEASVDDFSQRTLADPGLRTFFESNRAQPLDTWPLPSWGLDDLVCAAFYYNADLDVARARWGMAEAAKITAGAIPNPTLNLTPGYDTTRSIPSPWLPFTFIDIPLETAGKRRYRVGQATHLSEAARLGLAASAWQVRSRVRSSLVALSSARAAEALLQQQQRAHAENLALLERQRDAGVISAFELTQARVFADMTHLALREAERQSAETRVQLADAIGVPVVALDGATITPEALNALPEGTSIDQARRQALLTRPDILALLAEYAASQSALQLEIAKQIPDVHLGPGYQYDQGENKWSLGVTFTLPLLNQNQGGIAEAEAKRTEVAARFNAMQGHVLAEIDRAFTAYQMARRKQADAEIMLTDLQRQESLARSMLDLGEISKGDLAGVRLQVGASMLAGLEARTKSQEALGALEDALQSPLAMPATAWQSPPRLSSLDSEGEGR